MGTHCDKKPPRRGTQVWVFDRNMMKPIPASFIEVNPKDGWWRVKFDSSVSNTYSTSWLADLPEKFFRSASECLVHQITLLAKQLADTEVS
jgi:hypothetical protein